MDGQDGWNEYRRLVLKSLEDLWRCHGEVEARLQEARLDVAVLKVKAGLWGLCGGLLAVGLALFVRYLEK